MIPPFWEENGSGAEGGFRRTPTQGIDSVVQTTGAYGDVQLPVGVAIPTDVEIFDGTSVSLPTVVPEKIKTWKAISKEPSPEYEREFGRGSHGYQRAEASVEKAARTPDYTRTRLRREPRSSTHYFLQSESPQPISSLSSSGTAIAGFASGNSGQNQHLFSPAASPPLILAFLAVGLFTLSMIGVFGWRRVQYTRGVGRADLAWLGAGGVRGLGGTVVGVDGRESKDGGEVKVRPKLWDLWTSTGDSGEDLKRAKRKGKRRSEYENQEKEGPGTTWGDIMPISVRIIAPPPKPDTPSTTDGKKKKKKKHGKSKKRKSRPVSGITATTAEATAEPTTTAAESTQADGPPTSAPSSRFTLFRIPLRIHRWARRKYFRRPPPPAPPLTPQPSNTSNTTNIPNPNRTSSDSASGRESNPDIALSPLQRVARSENAQPWADWRTVEIPRSRPSGSGSRSPRRSSDRTRPSPNHASSSNTTTSPQANGADGGGAAEEEDPYLNDLDKQLEREGLERCPITGMIVEKRDGIVGDIRNGIRKRQRRREGRGTGGGSRKEKERARVQVAVAIVMPTPQAARARRVQEAVMEEKPKAIEPSKKKRRRRRRVKQNELPAITVEVKDKADVGTSDDSPPSGSAHTATQDTPAPTQAGGIAPESPQASLHPPSAPTLSPTLPSSTPNPSRPPTRMTLTSDGGSVNSYVTAPDDNVSGGEKTPTRVQSPEPQPSPAQGDNPSPPVDVQPSPAEAPTDSSQVDASSQEPEGGVEDLESEYEEYTDSESESDSDPAPSRPVLINFGSEEENRRREETARQIVYAFGLYECQWKLSSSASRSRHKESLKAIGVQVAGSQPGLAGSTSGSRSGSGYSTGSGSATGTGTSSSEASSGRNSGVASPREALPGPGRIRAVGWGRRT